MKTLNLDAHDCKFQSEITETGNRWRFSVDGAEIVNIDGPSESMFYLFQAAMKRCGYSKIERALEPRK